MTTPDGMTVVAKKRPGRRPKYMDGALKVQKSRQIARECRARKRLRYQYLEDLVKSKEKAIFDLRRELDSFLALCKEVDTGNMPECLLKIIDIEVNRKETSASFLNEKGKKRKCHNSHVGAAVKVDIPEDYDDSDNMCEKIQVKGEKMPMLLSLLNGPTSTKSSEPYPKMKKLELQQDNWANKPGSDVQANSSDIFGNMCNIQPDATMTDTNDCSVQNNIFSGNNLNYHKHFNSGLKSSVSQIPQNESHYYGSHQFGNYSNNRFSNLENYQEYSFHSDPRSHHQFNGNLSAIHDTNAHYFSKLLNERPCYNAGRLSSKTSNHMDISINGALDTHNNLQHPRVLNDRKGLYCSSLSSQGNEDRNSSSSSLSEMDYVVLENSTCGLQTNKEDISKEQFMYDRNCMLNNRISNQSFNTTNKSMYDTQSFGVKTDLSSLSSRTPSVIENSPSSLADMYNEHKELINSEYEQNGHQITHDIVDWLLQNENYYKHCKPSPPFLTESVNILHDNSFFN